MPAVEWFYAKGNRQCGPVSSAELKQLADRGELGADDLVWREGMDDWMAARKVKGLFEAEAVVAKPLEAPKAVAPPAKAEPAAAAPKPAEPVAPVAKPEVKTAEPLPAEPEADPRPSSSRSTQATFEQSTAAYERSREGDRFHLFDYFLEMLRKQFTRQFVDAAARLFGVAGHYSLYVSMLAVVLFEVTFVMKAGRDTALFFHLTCVIALAVLQYAAGRFSGILERLQRATSGQVSSTAFLDSFALLHLLLGLAALIILSIFAVRPGPLSWTFPAIAVFILCQYAAIVALNPESLNLVVNPATRVAEEALGILTFLAKLILRCVPVGYGVGVVWGTLRLVWAEAMLFLPAPADSAAAEVSGGAVPLPIELKYLAAQETAQAAVWVLLVAAALPFVIYPLFLLASLLIDILRSLLHPLRSAEAKRDEG